MKSNFTLSDIEALDELHKQVDDAEDWLTESHLVWPSVSALVKRLDKSYAVCCEERLGALDRAAAAESQNAKLEEIARSAGLATEQARSKLKAATEALEFYADDAVYTEESSSTEASVVYDDLGHKARAALNAIREDEK